MQVQQPTMKAMSHFDGHTRETHEANWATKKMHQLAGWSFLQQEGN